MHAYRHTSLIIHPKVAQLSTEVAALRALLAEALRRLVHLEEIDGPHLSALYQRELAPLQIALLERRALLKSLEYRIGALTARLNRGEPISENFLRELDAEIEAKLAAYTDEIGRQRQALDQAQHVLLDLAELSREDTARRKKLYHQLCQLLHPDMAQVDPALHRKWWPLVQSAYTAGDLAQLESIALILGAKDLAAGAFDARDDGLDRLDALRAEQARLREQLESKLEAQLVLESRPPLSYKKLLSDEVWMREKKTDLGAQANALDARITVLARHLEQMLGGLN